MALELKDMDHRIPKEENPQRLKAGTSQYSCHGGGREGGMRDKKKGGETEE